MQNNLKLQEKKPFTSLVLDFTLLKLDLKLQHKITFSQV